MEHSEKLEQVVNQKILITNIQNVEKKSSRITFEVVVEANKKKKELSVEFWENRIFCKIYDGKERTFFSEEVLPSIVSLNQLGINTEIDDKTHDKLNNLFMNRLEKELKKTEAYKNLF